MLQLKGTQGKILIVNEGKVTIKCSGFLTSTRENSILIKNINSVDIKKPGVMYNGYIHFSIAGGKELKSDSIVGYADNAIHDENSVVFRKKEDYNKALEIKSYIENYQQNTNNQSNDSNLSISNEIIKLKELLDNGVLTESEFSHAKEKLINSL